MRVLSPYHRENDMSVTTIGIDLAKNVFHIHGVDAEGRSVLRRKTSRAGFERLMAGIPGCRVGMEAGSGSHRWARQLQAQGHDVKLLAMLSILAQECWPILAHPPSLNLRSP